MNRSLQRLIQNYFDNFTSAIVEMGRVLLNASGILYYFLLAEGVECIIENSLYIVCYLMQK